MDLVTLDLVLRAGGIAILLLMAALLMRDAIGQLAGRLLALFVVATAAYLVVSAPGAMFSPWIGWPLIVLTQANPVFFYLASRAMFDDGFRLKPHHGVVLAAMVALGIFCLAPPDGSSSWAVAFGSNLRRLATIVLVAMAIIEALRGRTADLLAGRQRFRFFFALAVGAYSIALTVVELAFFGTGLPLLPATINAGAIALLAGGFFLALFSLSAQGALVPLAEPKPPVASQRPVSSEQSEDAPILAALDKAMAADRLYRQDGLTIGSLATRLAVPEYRLRRAINRQLGFRNFNAYLNALRLAEVKSALIDPTQREVPITTIALDAGFASIGPFNRAFKAATGTVPSEFRRRALAEA